MMTQKEIEEQIIKVKAAIKGWEERIREPENIVYTTHVSTTIVKLKGELKAYQKVLDTDT